MDTGSGSDSGSDSDSSDSADDGDNERLINFYAEEIMNDFYFYLFCQEACELSSVNPPKKKKKANEHRDRQGPLNFILSWSDDMFYRHFRLVKDELYDLLEKMKDGYPGSPRRTGRENLALAYQMGDLSSGTHIPLELKLMVTLRLLAGANYLDMIWYGISVDSVSYVFKSTIDLIQKVEPAIGVPTTDEGWRELLDGWDDISIRKKGLVTVPGTALAGDGLAIETTAPTAKDRGDVSLPAFRNRKGFYGLICQAFCDCNAKFRYFEVAWPGSTNDIIAYRQSFLYTLYLEGKIPEWVHFVLDEAYSPIGGDHHLTPYSRNQLRKARGVGDAGLEKYLQMKAFNNALSSYRITIERAFGILIRRFAILAKPLSFDIATNSKVAYVCAQLHNRSVDRWVRNGKGSGHLEPLRRSHDAEAFLSFEAPLLQENDEFYPTDDFIVDNFTNDSLEFNNNPIRGQERPSRLNIKDKRASLTKQLYESGIRFDLQADNDFTFVSDM